MYILREGLQTAAFQRFPDCKQRNIAVDSVTAAEGGNDSSGGCRLVSYLLRGLRGENQQRPPGEANGEQLLMPKRKSRELETDCILGILGGFCCCFVLISLTCPASGKKGYFSF